MHIDFNEIASMTFPGMDNGTGMISRRCCFPMMRTGSESIRSFPTGCRFSVFSSEKCLEKRSDKWLDKKKLCEESKREVKTYQL